jgi:uncharacterized circularly permuted ATP-grasp superfamily protein/uncharacterized alpha-E superfamily protein
MTNNTHTFHQQEKGGFAAVVNKDADPPDPVFPGGLLLSAGCNDVYTQDGTLTPHWQELITYLNRMGGRELDRRWQKARQIMHEHGVAYNVFSSEKEENRPWELDPIPCPMATETWDFLEKGISQRIRLLTAVYLDIYGPQKLIRNHHLPPELFFANPNFLRQCHGLYNADSFTLHFHATDLCRFPNGQWRVIGDQTQTPAGAGYALENRIILSRILPEMFHSGKVLRLAPFFKRLSHSLIKISGLAKREPFIVMLSSGPLSLNYFEYVFLSRYLGITLVESSDLTVRNDVVFLKTLGGLQRVDVIFRQIEDTACDPLAFGRAFVMGVPGLMQAVRVGNVMVSNPVGSRVLATPGLVPFLPSLCRLLLGEDLILQDRPTLWCGQPESRDMVLSRIYDSSAPMIIAPAFDQPHIPAVETKDMSREQLTVLTDKIKAAPYAYISRDAMLPCTLPLWRQGCLIDRWAAVRMFATAIMPTKKMTGMDFSHISGDEISVMPGALTRISDDPAAFLINSGKEQGSKDTLCFSKDVVEYESMLHQFVEPFEIHRGSDLSSRVADNMLWLGRYMERTEGLIRVVRSLLNRINSETRLDMIEELPFLLRIMANLKLISPDLAKPDAVYDMPVLESEITESMFDIRRLGSIRSTLKAVRQVASRVRDRMSNDSWHILGRMDNDLVLFAAHHHNRISEIQELLNEMLVTISAFAGLSMESMTRGMGWRFMDMGRRIERAGYMLTLLQSLFAPGGKPKSHEFETLLEVADSIITYHNRYRTTFHTEPIVDLLLLDELNPRSVGFQLAALLEHVETLPKKILRPFRTKEEKITLNLTTKLRLTDVRELMDPTHKGKSLRLNQLLELLNSGIQQLANAITERYLSRIETEKQLKNSMADPGDEI